jgi:hypothetical protein
MNDAIIVFNKWMENYKKNKKKWLNFYLKYRF